MIMLLALLACPTTDPAVADTGGDTSGDTAGVGDSGDDTGTYVGACAPPDAWTGPVDPALYSRAPYDSAYDAGLAAMVPYTQASGSSVYSDLSWLVYGATVTAVSVGDANCVPSVVIADSLWSVVVFDESSCENEAAVGDKVGFGTNTLGGSHGERRVQRVTGWTVLSSGNPVYVRELDAAALDYLAAFSQLTHAWGELTRTSSYDCGSGMECYLLDHQGTESLIRVPVDDAFGLGPDYVGGLCAEIVAPVGMYAGADGDALFLDVREGDWMRVWSAE